MKLSLSIIAVLAAFSGASAESPVKNVLFIISDDLRASALGCYGNDICRTPHIDALAERGMVFERAYCQGTWCQPSRTSLMHSRYVGARGPTLGQHLIADGVYSARVGKIFHMRVPGDIIAGTDGEDIAETWTERFNCSGQEAHTPGLYRLLNQNVETRSLEGRQSTRMPFRMFATVEADGDGSQQPDWKAAAKTVALLQERAAKEEPFFIALGLIRPHYPSVAPSEAFEEYSLDRIPDLEIPDDDWDDIPEMGLSKSTSSNTGIDRYPDNIRQMRADYYATVTFMDEQVGKVLAALSETGLDESTAVIFTSDHGYHLGEHHFWQKSNFREDVTRVPLIVSLPAKAPGRTKALAELVDIYPTVCEIMGVSIPETVQGKSLLPVISDPEEKVRSAAFSIDARTGAAIRTDEWTYIRYLDDSEEFYDMKSDPGQFNNLVDDPEFDETKKNLRRIFLESMESSQP